MYSDIYLLFLKQKYRVAGYKDSDWIYLIRKDRDFIISKWLDRDNFIQRYYSRESKK